MSRSWINKYEPKVPADIVGQDSQLNQIEAFILNYKTQKKKACLIYGPSGCGKTSSILALANKHNLEVLEVNASDFRNAEKLNTRLGPALTSQSLFKKSKLILIDEVDSLSGRKDRGAIPTMVKLIASSKFPIVCTANNPWDSKFSSLRSKCNLVKLNTLTHNNIFDILLRIIKEENLKYDESAVKSLSRRIGGDARAAINDLQSLKTITQESVNELSQRLQIETMPSALVKVFKNSDPLIALSAFDNVQENLDASILWIDENLPNEYQGKDLARAYDALSKADVYRGRIRKRQHWRFLVYVNSLITAGIAVSKSQKNAKFTQYKPTTRILRLWRAKMKFAKRKAIAEKLANKTHTSIKKATKQIPYLIQMFKNQEFQDQLTDYLDLNSEEVTWLQK